MVEDRDRVTVFNQVDLDNLNARHQLEIPILPSYLFTYTSQSANIHSFQLDYLTSQRTSTEPQQKHSTLINCCVAMPDLDETVLELGLPELFFLPSATKKGIATDHRDNFAFPLHLVSLEYHLSRYADGYT